MEGDDRARRKDVGNSEKNASDWKRRKNTAENPGISEGETS